MAQPDYDHTYIEQLSTLRPKDRRRLMRYFAGLPEPLACYAAEKLRAHSTDWRNVHRQLRKEGRKPSGSLKHYDPAKVAENYLVGLLVALNEIHRLEFAVRKARNLTEAELELCQWIAEQRKMQKNPRPIASLSEKTNYIIQHVDTITTMRESGLSYGQIAKTPQFTGYSRQWLHKIYHEELARREALAGLASSESALQAQSVKLAEGDVNQMFLFPN